MIDTLQKIRTGLKQAKSVAKAEALIHVHANFDMRLSPKTNATAFLMSI
jgi:hypothetical protein